MKVLIAGFSPQSTTAVELVVGSLWSDVTFVKLPRGTLPSATEQSVVAQDCALCVVDLLGLGMALWSAARETELQAFLAGRRAILFVPAGGSDDWLNAVQPGRLGPSRLLLQHPASTASLREALETLRERGQAESIAQAEARPETVAKSMEPAPAAADLLPSRGDAVRLGEAVAESADELPPPAVVEEDVQSNATAPFTERLLRVEERDDPPELSEALLPPTGEAAVKPADDREALLPAATAPLPVPTASEGEWADEEDDYESEPTHDTVTQPPRARWQKEEVTVPKPASRRSAAEMTKAGGSESFEFMAMTPEEGDGMYSAPVVPPHPLVRSDRRASAFSITGYSLDENAYSALLAASPDIARNPYLNLICNIVMRRSPSELRITTRTGAVFFPAENWVASNISTAFRKRLTQHEMMLQIVQVHQLQEEHAHDRAARLFGRRGDGPRSLDAFMWSLVFTTFEQSPPVSIGDLHFQVHRFPNFARLHKMPDLFSQLSQVCMRQPQSLSGLKRAFSKYDPNLVTLFVACTILSGVATVLQTGASAGAESATRSKRAPSRKTGPRAGLLRSLLDKLF